MVFVKPGRRYGRIERRVLFAHGEGDPQHLARKDDDGCGRAQALGELCQVVRLPEGSAGGRPGAVEEHAALLARSVLAQPAATVFLAGVIGAGIEAGVGDDGVAVGVRQAGERVAQAGAAERAKAGNGGDLLRRLLGGRQLLQGALHQDLDLVKQAIEADLEMAQLGVDVRPRRADFGSPCRAR